MHGARWLGLVLAVVAGLSSCAFPDVDYADGGTGGACAGLTGCTAAATSCAATADGQHDTCIQACKNLGCTMKCDQDQTTAHAACATTCAKVCAPGCASGESSCAAAVGP